MKRTVRTLILTSGILCYFCSQNPSTDSTDFVFRAESVEGDEASVITGIREVIDKYISEK